MNKSAWLPPGRIPDFVGFYETKDIVTKKYYFNYWDGENWHWGARTLVQQYTGGPMPLTNLECWRGLTEEPSKGR